MRVCFELKKNDLSETLAALAALGFVPEEPVDPSKLPLEDGSLDQLITAGTMPAAKVDALHQIDGVVSWQPLEM